MRFAPDTFDGACNALSGFAFAEVAVKDPTGVRHFRCGDVFGSGVFRADTGSEVDVDLAEEMLDERRAEK